jgi:3',5'-cyclic AMP phosphodiesterase CpdA
MLLLHLSDLHFGPQSRFAREDLNRLGKTLQSDLKKAIGHFGIKGKVDLVVITGDVAESGRPKEFEMGVQFLTSLAGELGLEHRRFVFVPGNHDLFWTDCRRVVLDQDEEGFDGAELRRRLDAVKLRRYEDFLKKFYGVENLWEVAMPLGYGAYLHDFSELHLSIGGLNSCERESHRKSDHLGFLSRQQAESLMKEWLAAGRAGWLKVVAVHHNPVVTVHSNLMSWRDHLLKTETLDHELIERYESDSVGFEGKEHLRAIVTDIQPQLILHGHHHAKDEQPWPWRAGAMGYTHVLSAGSLSLQSSALPQDEPLSFRLIDLDPEAEEVRAYSLIYDVRARTPYQAQWGAFVPDFTESGGYRQRLDLPEGFARETGRVARKNEESEPSPGFIRTYRQALGQSFARWELSVGAVQSGGANRPIEAALDDMYQPLRLAEGFSVDDVERGAPLEEESLLTRSRPLMIRGPAGTGKTTWIRYTFRRLIRMERSLPVMLIVRDLARCWQEPDCRGAERSLDAFLNAWVAEHLGAGWEGELRLSLESESGARPVLLVDGWDEAGRLGEDLREKLLIFMERYPRLLVVVTSRPYGEAQPSRRDGFTVLDTQPLSDGEIQQLTRRFFLQCHREDEAVATQEAERFWAALERAPEPRGLARTALLLTMMLLISRSELIPEKRHLLYEKCIDCLLTALPDRKADQGAILFYEQYRPDDSEVRKRVVAALAFALQEQGYKKTSRSSIVGKWEELAMLLPQDWSAPRRSGFLAWLAGSAGLLTENADGTLAFTHLSFQEYLCAWHLHATVEGADRRRQEFIARQQSYDWWETLRLWAALIERQSPERLESVLDSVLACQSDGLAFIGAIFADGLGPEEAFRKWCSILLDELSAGWPPQLEFCTRAWSVSRQDTRKHVLGGFLAEGADNLLWASWMRRREFQELASLSREIPMPGSRLCRALIEVIYGNRSEGRDAIATARLLCGGPSIWPIEPIEIGLLQVWPGDRRLLGMRLQSAALAGATTADLREILRLMPVPSDKSEKEVRDLARYLARYLSGGFPHDFSRYLYRYFSRHFDRYLDRYFARNFARYLDRYFPRHSHRPRDLAREFALALAHDFPHDFARDLAYAQSLEPGLPWLLDFSRWEISSAGRAGARFVLAQMVRLPESPLLNLVSEACRLSLNSSLNRAVFRQLLADTSPSLDPLWPALARHLARNATSEDRSFLSDLAQHPEKCREESLSWGLQFIVRGDVLLENDSIITLDELTDQAGLPRLPYLEDLPDELEQAEGVPS